MSNEKLAVSKLISLIFEFWILFNWQVDRKPRLVGGAMGHNIKETSFPGSHALCAESFTFELRHLTFRIIK